MWDEFVAYLNQIMIVTKRHGQSEGKSNLSLTQPSLMIGRELVFIVIWLTAAYVGT